MSPAPICEKVGCKRAAQVVPKLIIPYSVAPNSDPAKQYGILLGAKLCRRCCRGLSAHHQAAQPPLVAYVQQCARAQAKARGLPYQEPDFARAKIAVVRLDSIEYRQHAPELKPLVQPKGAANAG